MSSVSNVIFGTMTLGYGGYGSRVHDLETARLMFDAFAAAGYRDVDTAHGCGNGSCEQMLGDLGVPKDFSVAARLATRRPRRYRRRRANRPPELAGDLPHRLTQSRVVGALIRWWRSAIQTLSTSEPRLSLAADAYSRTAK
jgi:aryl-alcohol dehydrogenase-like predicted oxidoreductase